MDLFVKCKDENGTSLYFTKEEIETINKRLEFAQTIKVRSDNMTRPLYVTPHEFEQGKRRYLAYGGDASYLLNVQKSIAWEQMLGRVQKKADTFLLLFFAVSAVALWYLGGGKTPGIAYAVFSPASGGSGYTTAGIAFVVVVLVAVAGMVVRSKRRKGPMQAKLSNWNGSL